MTSVSTEGQQRDEKPANYEEAMKKAFGEIFRNLKQIEKDTKLQRLKVDLERRRGSAPASTLRETTAVFKKPKEEITRKLSTPIPPKSNLSQERIRKLPATPPPAPHQPGLSTMQWVLTCFEEEEDIMVD